MPWEFKINKYIAIKEHLEKFKDNLSNRPEVKSNRYPWYAMSRYGSDYVDEFEKEKIVWNPVSGEYYFTFLQNEMYFNNSLFMITGKNLKYILAFMNSRLNKWLITQMTNLIETGKYAYGSKDKIELLPIPKISEDKQKPFENLVDEIMQLKEKNEDTKELETKIDKMVYELYGLSEDEVRVVDES